MSGNRLFLGLDSSTQGLKATVIDERLEVVYSAAVHYDQDLPEFKTSGGVHRGADGLTVTAPPLMWVAALDLLLSKMQREGAALDRIAAISGSGQQHGSVWMNERARPALRALAPARTLREQLAEIFSVGGSPIWMDSSTTAECAALEAALGGPQAVAELTGSRAYERFTGNQIAKIHRVAPEDYAKTDRISLVSSFVASLLIGDVAPIDASDGAGMNLMDLRGKCWSPKVLNATAPDLARRLGPIVPSHQVVGALHPYYVARYGFSAACRVIAFSGDNPNSLAGLRLNEAGEIAISLGTSDTLFASLSHPRPSASEGHIFVNPVDPDGYMALICRKNGSLARERIRDEAAGGSWKTYGKLMETIPPGNGGQVGFYFFEPEITPPVLKAGVHRFDAEGRSVPAFAPAAEARAVLEGQFLSLSLHAAHIGIEVRRILATGGASVDPAVLRVMADVFGASVYVADRSDSASLGAAYRAAHGLRCAEQGKFVPFAAVMAAAQPFRLAQKPDAEAHAVYRGMLARVGELESRVMGG